MTEEPRDAHTQFYADGKCEILKLACNYSECRSCIVPIRIKLDEVGAKLDTLYLQLRKLL